MEPLAVVKDFDPIEDGGAGLGAGGKLAPMHKLRVPTIQFWDEEGDPNNPDSLLQRVHRGEGWETMHVQAMFDDQQRLMILAIHNSDVSDGWEREGENRLRLTRICGHGRGKGARKRPCQTKSQNENNPDRRDEIVRHYQMEADHYINERRSEKHKSNTKGFLWCSVIGAACVIFGVMAKIHILAYFGIACFFTGLGNAWLSNSRN